MGPIFSASIGGISPSLLTLAIFLVNGGSLPNSSYLVGLLIFAFLGGVICWIWREQDRRKAFYLGIGLPSLIQLTVATNDVSTSDNLNTVYFWHTDRFVYAQSDIQALEPRSLQVNIKGDQEPIVVNFSSADENQTMSKVVENSGTIVIPDFADTVSVKPLSNISTSRGLTLPDSRTIELEVKLSDNWWSGFQRAFGNYKAPAKNVNLGIR
ncbi:MAG: hypothetical protein QNJ60_01855 [Xenococcaceae cyanobacterium MO_188.B19]|nr:hypothetical protein [Xenococcaceae cyanobacterium MO_188.B19]